MWRIHRCLCMHMHHARLISRTYMRSRSVHGLLIYYFWRELYTSLIYWYSMAQSQMN